MKSGRILIKILTILSVIWAGIMWYLFMGREEQVISPFFMAIYSTVVSVSLIALHLASSRNERVPMFTFLFFLITISLATIMWYSPSTISSLWNYLFASMALLFSWSLLPPKDQSKPFVRLIIILGGIFLAILFAFKIMPYSWVTTAMIVLALVSLFGIFGLVKKN